MRRRGAGSSMRARDTVRYTNAWTRRYKQVLTLYSNYGRLAYELYLASWPGGLPPRQAGITAPAGEEGECAWPAVSLDVVWHDPH